MSASRVLACGSSCWNSPQDCWGFVAGHESKSVGLPQHQETRRSLYQEPQTKHHLIVNVRSKANSVRPAPVRHVASATELCASWWCVQSETTRDVCQNPVGIDEARKWSVILCRHMKVVGVQLSARVLSFSRRYWSTVLTLHALPLESGDDGRPVRMRGRR